VLPVAVSTPIYLSLAVSVTAPSGL